MRPTGIPKSEDAGLERLWLQVCASRGTPVPDRAQCGQFLQGLGADERYTLENILALAARGRERPGDLSLLSWAASCTRPALFDQLATHGLAFTGAALFACGLALKQEGWDMQQRIAQLQNNPGDVDTLRAWLPAVLPVKAGQAEEDPPKEAGPDSHEDRVVDTPLFPWPDDDDVNNLPGGQAPGGDESPAASNPSESLSVLPTRFARQRPEPFANSFGAPDEPRLRLRLFGKAAAHTLEVTAHRRGGDFLGVHVVSIDSAHALGDAGGYAWARKLVIQLTPEEMPAVIATLMGLTPSVRYGHHGANRDKFVEVRRQDGGLVMVTGEKALSYSVPVPTASIYYVLDLFCRAMAMNTPGRSVSDVLMLVKSAHGF